MGVYNFYGDKLQLQLKVGINDPEEAFKHFNVGDKVDIPDGIYIGEGAIAIHNGILVAETENVFDKWGNQMSLSTMIQRRSPVYQATQKTLRSLGEKYDEEAFGHIQDASIEQIEEDGCVLVIDNRSHYVNKTALIYENETYWLDSSDNKFHYFKKDQINQGE